MRQGSHGTHDFYEQRAEITKELLSRGHFHAVALEADFPDAFRANLYARGFSEGTSEDALADFKARRDRDEAAGGARNPGTPKP